MEVRGGGWIVECAAAFEGAFTEISKAPPLAARPGRRLRLGVGYYDPPNWFPTYLPLGPDLPGSDFAAREEVAKAVWDLLPELSKRARAARAGGVVGCRLCLEREGQPVGPRGRRAPQKEVREVDQKTLRALAEKARPYLPRTSRRWPSWSSTPRRSGRAWTERVHGFVRSRVPRGLPGGRAPGPHPGRGGSGWPCTSSYTWPPQASPSPGCGSWRGPGPRPEGEPPSPGSRLPRRPLPRGGPGAGGTDPLKPRPRTSGATGKTPATTLSTPPWA